MLRSRLIKKITFTNVGNVILKENIMYTILHRIRDLPIELTMTKEFDKHLELMEKDND